MRTRLLQLLGVAVFLGGCADPESVQLFTTDQVVDAAKAFQAALVAKDDAALALLCRAPFRFQARTWDDSAELAANLKKETGRVRHLHADHDSYEAHSRFDLKEGRWPRQESVPEAARAARIEKLGLRENGWVVRVYSGDKAGYRLTLNAEGASRLVVTGVEF